MKKLTLFILLSISLNAFSQKTEKFFKTAKSILS